MIASLQAAAEGRAALQLQRVFRGHRGRARFKRLWLEHWSAVAIQDWWKNRLSRALAKEVLAFRRRTRPAATAFQKMWRGYVARHKVAGVREHFRVRAAATCYGAWEAAHTQHENPHKHKKD